MTKRQVKAAFAVAVITDLIQIPLVLGMFVAAASFFGAFADLPLEGADLAIDCVAAFLITRLIGFHWLLLPTAVTEAIPGLDVLPTWTLCVAWVVRQRNRQLSA